jgi:hypothetical protein
MLFAFETHTKMYAACMELLLSTKHVAPVNVFSLYTPVTFTHLFAMCTTLQMHSMLYFRPPFCFCQIRYMHCQWQLSTEWKLSLCACSICIVFITSTSNLHSLAIAAFTSTNGFCCLRRDGEVLLSRNRRCSVQLPVGTPSLGAKHVHDYIGGITTRLRGVRS